MSDTPEAVARHARALVATLVEALGAAVMAARAEGSTSPAAATLIRLIEQWRAEFTNLSPAAVEPARLVIGLTALVALCDVRLVATAAERGVHIDGPAAPAFDAALRLIHLRDRLCGTTIGEETMAALLGGFIGDLPVSAPSGGGLH